MFVPPLKLEGGVGEKHFSDDFISDDSVLDGYKEDEGRGEVVGTNA